VDAGDLELGFAHRLGSLSFLGFTHRFGFGGLSLELVGIDLDILFPKG